jgi:protocatechuate 3,4-dioxygenase beta subunit
MRHRPGSRFPEFLLAAGILCGVAVSDLSAITVSGTVVAREGDRLKPVFRATVAAREAAGPDIVAVARTDRDGRFLMVDLPSPRVSLSARKNGYYSRLVNGREHDALVLDCSVPEDCEGVTFELGRAAVLSGTVVDEWGEPLDDVSVTVLRGDETQGSAVPVSGGNTDDRGAFRIAGLKPGEYTVKAEYRRQRFYRAPALLSEPVNVTVAEGEEVGGFQIAVRREPPRETFSVSGNVAGMDSSQKGSYWIQMRSARAPGSGRPRNGGMSRTRVSEDGSFGFRGIMVGHYSLSLHQVGQPENGRETGSWPLGTVEVSGDVSGLRLHPLPAAGIRGVVEFESDRIPRQLAFLVMSEENEFVGRFAVEPPDLSFTVGNLMPGRYRVSVAAVRRDRRLYVKGIRRGDEFLASKDFEISEGIVETVTVVVSDEMGRVYGRVKAPAEPGAERVIRKGSQFRVVLSGPNRATLTVQADQYGRFQFEDVPPGDYRICAWADLGSRSPSNDRIWEEAGNAVREFPVEAGSDIEIDLTAAP